VSMCRRQGRGDVASGGGRSGRLVTRWRSRSQWATRVEQDPLGRSWCSARTTTELVDLTAGLHPAGMSTCTVSFPKLAVTGHGTVIGIALSHREGPGAAAFLRCRLTIRSARSGALLGLDGPATGESSIARARQMCEVIQGGVRSSFGVCGCMWLLRPFCLFGRVLRSAHTVRYGPYGLMAMVMSRD
jgi:hypothetical protein